MEYMTDDKSTESEVWVRNVPDVEDGRTGLLFT